MAIDGGHKFTLFGWQILILSVVNECQEGSACLLCVMSHMDGASVSATMRKLNDATARITGVRPSIKYGVNDAENVFQKTVAVDWGGQWLMCWMPTLGINRRTST